MHKNPRNKKDTRLDKVEKKVNALGRTVNAELKYRDEPAAAFGFANVPNTGSFVVLNALSQGDSATTRTGNSIVQRNLEMRLNVRWATASAVPTATLRVMLIWDRQANGSLPNASNVLQFVDYLSPINDSYRKRFKVIYDKNLSVQSTGPSIVQTKKLKKLSNTVTRYSGNGGTIADITTNSLFMFMISSEAVNGPLVNYAFRMRYTDF